MLHCIGFPSVSDWRIAMQCATAVAGTGVNLLAVDARTSYSRVLDVVWV
jgi:hypothetical protein